MIEYRKYHENEIDACTELFMKVFSEDPWNDAWDSFDYAKQYLEEFAANPSFEGYVACEDGKIVGACFGHKRSWWSGKEMFIDEMFIDGTRQGQGIGTGLLEFLKSDLLSQGVKSLVLLTGKDLPSEKFYRKNGFSHIQETIVMGRRID